MCSFVQKTKQQQTQKLRQVGCYAADIFFSSTQGASVQSVLFANADGQMGASLKKKK